MGSTFRGSLREALFEYPNCDDVPRDENESYYAGIFEVSVIVQVCNSRISPSATR